MVDRDGNTLVQLRGDGAGPQSFESASKKAYTAVAWNAPTSELVKRLDQAPTLKDIPGTLFLAGGAPVQAQGAPIAGIGVAGAAERCRRRAVRPGGREGAREVTRRDRPALAGHEAPRAGPPGGAGPPMHGGTSDVDAEVLGDADEARGVALADGAELPLGAVAVELAEDHGGLGRRVLAEVVAGDLGAAGLVDDADEGVPHLAEVLAAVLGVVDRDREDDLLDVGRQARQVDLDLLVVALALAGDVVAGVLDGLVRRRLVVEEDKVLVGVDLAARVDRDGARVEVEVRAGGGADVPAEADRDGGQARCLLGERDVAALGQAYSHGDVPFLRRFVGLRAADEATVTLLNAMQGTARFHHPLLSLPNPDALARAVDRAPDRARRRCPSEKWVTGTPAEAGSWDTCPGPMSSAVRSSFQRPSSYGVSRGPPVRAASTSTPATVRSSCASTSSRRRRCRLCGRSAPWSGWRAGWSTACCPYAPPTTAPNGATARPLPCGWPRCSRRPPRRRPRRAANRGFRAASTSGGCGRRSSAATPSGAARAAAGTEPRTPAATRVQAPPGRPPSPGRQAPAPGAPSASAQMPVLPPEVRQRPAVRHPGPRRSVRGR